MGGRKYISRSEAMNCHEFALTSKLETKAIHQYWISRDSVLKQVSLTVKDGRSC
jgi:hypothetical protein